MSRGIEHLKLIVTWVWLELFFFFAFEREVISWLKTNPDFGHDIYSNSIQPFHSL